MGRQAANESFLQSFLGKFLRRPSRHTNPALTPLAILERLHDGQRPDYCLYLRPSNYEKFVKKDPLSIDLEALMIQAFHPLPMIVLDETARTGNTALPDEAFLELAKSARVLAVAPTADEHFLQRLRLIKKQGAIARCIFIMPEAESLGAIDWPAVWPMAREAAAALGIELSGYTAGGWLFRLGKDGKACTFRSIVNPNADKVAKALEGICGEME